MAEYEPIPCADRERLVARALDRISARLSANLFTDRVRVDYHPMFDQSYSDSHRTARMSFNGCVGDIIDFERGHGLCFMVAFKVSESPGAARAIAWYEPGELENAG